MVIAGATMRRARVTDYLFSCITFSPNRGGRGRWRPNELAGAANPVPLADGQQYGQKTTIGMALTARRSVFKQAKDTDHVDSQKSDIRTWRVDNERCWDQARAMLEEIGVATTAVRLSLTALADDAAIVTQAIAAQDGPVVLAGHSYGGAVITQAGASAKVSGLVYINAFVPDIGESALGLSRLIEPARLNTEEHPGAHGLCGLPRKNWLAPLPAQRVFKIILLVSSGIPGVGKRPNRMPMATACARSLAHSFCIIFFM
jgi:hypothetical protein